jgi:ABC-type phosphate/phosphonate transport system substrate-binding protein
MNCRKSIAITVAVATILGGALSARSEELKIAIIQAQAGDARKYQPLLDYLAKNGVAAKFISTADYPSSAKLFSAGGVDAMFGGSGISGAMIMKNLADPLVRPVSNSGSSTYHAVVVAPKGGAAFSGDASYFNGKRVIFAPLATAGEFYFRSLGTSSPKETLKAANHGAAMDGIGRGVADVAVVKNHVWEAEKAKYPQLEKVGEDKGENPDGTLIVSKKLAPATAKKITDILLGIKGDSAPEATAAKDSLKIREFIPTTTADFAHTIELIKKSGLESGFGF